MDKYVLISYLYYVKSKNERKDYDQLMRKNHLVFLRFSEVKNEILVTKIFYLSENIDPYDVEQYITLESYVVRTFQRMSSTCSYC